jgi:hypothetical protein
MKGFGTSKWWKIWKHALGSFDEEDGYDPVNENRISVIRTFIVFTNLLCGWIIIINIIKDWI